jgi:hypothetical protein
MKKQTEIDKLEKEVQDLELEIKNKENIEQLESKRKILELKIKQMQFRKKHPKLLKVTGSLASGTKGFFKGMGKLIKGSVEALNKSDKWIAEQEIKERKPEIFSEEAYKNYPHHKENSNKRDTSINDALNLVD